MNTPTKVIGIIGLIIVAVLLVVYVPKGTATPGHGSATTTPGQSITTPQGITFSYPANYGLATNPQQILASSYIPPCDQGFNYCVYKNDNQFAGTNFESAGMSVANRTDIANERLCLNTPPEGFDASTTPDNTYSADTYATSVFKNAGQAAAGHTASDMVYRLFNRANGSCTQFTLRIAQSQYANYPEGTIEEFTNADAAQVASELLSMLMSVTLGGAPVTWPQ